MMSASTSVRSRCVGAGHRARAMVIKALAHPTRLFIVEELVEGPRCVCELTAMVGDDISTVSRHLAVLRNAGIVDDERRGAQIFYSLRTPCILQFFSCIEAVTGAAEAVPAATGRAARTVRRGRDGR